MTAESNPSTVTVVVPKAVESERLDRFLADNPDLDLSRSRIQKLIESGLVTVDGVVQPARYRVRPGQVAEITLVPDHRPELAAEDIPLEIVYGDDHLAVINKPAGMVTHPAPGNYSGTLVHALLHRFGQLSSSSGDDRPGIVHRLDKNTSGLLVVARTDRTYRRLQQAIQAREVQRSYLGLIWGRLPESSGTIELPIGRSRKDRKKMAVKGQASRPAVTAYSEVKLYRSFQLLELALHTGRTHQIRVHLSHMGHPVFGDSEYGGRDKQVRGMFAPERPLARELLSLLKRQALHASRLVFEHPETGESLSFEVSPPADFRSVLDLLDRKGH
jgi:23S rRNA pseudouridine1911/1915/1917 synthase